MYLLATLIDLYSLVLIVAVIVSWLNLSPSQPPVRLLRQLTEPILGPIRSVIPPLGGLDFSPLIALLLLYFLRNLILRAG